MTADRYATDVFEECVVPYAILLYICTYNKGCYWTILLLWDYYYGLSCFNPDLGDTEHVWALDKLERWVKNRLLLPSTLGEFHTGPFLKRQEASLMLIVFGICF